MAYLIYDIATVTPEDYPFYFFDANVWISGLIYYAGSAGKPHEKPYQDFVEAIVQLNSFTEPKLVKKLKNQPKIIVTNLLVSEIINAFMRKVAMKAFYGGSDIFKTKDFKKDYRDLPASDYVKQIQDLCHNLKCFEDYTVSSDGHINVLQCYDIIKAFSIVKADFNDFCFMSYLKGKNIPFITHDQDCKFEDIPIITANPVLLRHSTV